MRGILYILILMLQLQATTTLSVCGTGDSQELLKALATAYEKQDKTAKIIILPSIGSGGGIRSVAFDKCDLGRVARKLYKSEEKFHLNYVLLAKSAVVFVTNPNIKKIKNITTKELVDIFDGTVKRWNELDKETEGKIFLARRELGDSSSLVLKNHIKEMKKIKKPAGKVLFTTQKNLRTICKYKNTIGYLPYSEVIHSKLNILNFNGVEASVKNILENRYILTIPFGLVYKGELSGLSKEFVSFIESEEGKKIILEYGAVPNEVYN